ncbi:MAG: acylglycerol kinase family protein, partial [Planctomycetota bacterium]
MAALPNHLVIVNPTSGGGRPRGFKERIGKKLAAAGLACEIVETVGPGDATNLAREAAYERDVVVAVGGDGTAHEVASGLGQARDARHGNERPRAALALVPAG